MPRNMSFMLTTQQIRDRTKTVTRRLKWTHVKPGDILNACVKCQGIKKGEKVQRLCQIRVTDVRREALDKIDDTTDIPWSYAITEVTKEGFPSMSGCEFVTMFCENMKCDSSTEVTRIEFVYVKDGETC